jgi:putative peptide zinc metalloprotease protein
VVFSILWFIDSALKPYRLEVFARAIAVLLIGSMIAMPLVSLVRYLRVPGRWEQIERYRLHVAAVAVGIALAAVTFVPVPRRVITAMELEPRDAANVFINMPGVLVETFVAPGDYVEQGAVLARLENVDLDLEIAEIEAKRDHYASRVAMLWHRRFNDVMAGRHLAEAEKTLASFNEQLDRKHHDRHKVTLVAERSGTVLPPPELPRHRPQEGELATWAGSPLERRNAGCWLEMGTLLCQIGDPQSCDALVVVEQSDVAAVQKGQNVTIKIDAYPERTFRGSVEEIARDELKVSPRHLSNKSGGALSTKTDERGIERLMNVSYHVRVPIDASEMLPVGSRGQAKIDVAWQSLGRQAWRWFWQTFHFEV